MPVFVMHWGTWQEMETWPKLLLMKGHTFCDAYLKLDSFKQFNVPVMAVTGSFTFQSLDIFIGLLMLSSSIIVHLPLVRNNLFIAIKGKKLKRFSEEIIKLIKTDQTNSS